MEFINALSNQLGIDQDGARGLAGSLIGGLKDHLGGSEADTIASAIPELGGWQQQAAALAGGSSDASGLLSAASGLLGGSAGGLAGLGSVMALVKNLGLDQSALVGAAPVVLGFLKERLPAELVGKIEGLLPLLTGGSGGGGGGGGGLGGALGGLFG